MRREQLDRGLDEFRYRKALALQNRNAGRIECEISIFLGSFKVLSNKGWEVPYCCHDVGAH